MPEAAAKESLGLVIKNLTGSFVGGIGMPKVRAMREPPSTAKKGQVRFVVASLKDKPLPPNKTKGIVFVAPVVSAESALEPEEES